MAAAGLGARFCQRSLRQSTYFSPAAIDIAAMSNPNHQYPKPVVFNHVDRTIVADSNAVDIALFVSVLLRPTLKLNREG